MTWQGRLPRKFGQKNSPVLINTAASHQDAQTHSLSHSLSLFRFQGRSLAQTLSDVKPRLRSKAPVRECDTWIENTRHQMRERDDVSLDQQPAVVGSLFGGCTTSRTMQQSAEQQNAAPPQPWATRKPVMPAASGSEYCGLAADSEAMSRIEAMELARLAAEERARLDEEEWHEEELRLQAEEAHRRQARAERELEEQRREAALLKAERRALGLIDDELHDGAEPASAGLGLADLLAQEGNQWCFDCDAKLGGGGETDAMPSLQGVWWSLTHGTLLCKDCAEVHLSLGTQTSVVRSAESHEAPSDSDLDALFAGGNYSFGSFLAEDGVGVPRRVWLALPIDARYHTPAAELYRRRLQALVNGEVQPTELPRKANVGPTSSASSASQHSTSAYRAAALPEPALSQRTSGASARWAPPESEGGLDESMTDYLTAMADMRKRIEAAKATAARNAHSSAHVV